MKKYLTGLLLAAAISSPALSADLAYKASPYSPVPIQNWTGWFVGGHIGYQAGTITGPGVFGANTDTDRVFGGVQGGYRLQLQNNLVLGAQVAIPIFGKGDDVVAPFGGGTLSMKSGFTVIPSLQLGYALGNFLPFVGYGIGVSDTKVTLTGGGATASAKRFVPVHVFTAGLDYKVAPSWVVGVRYNYTHTDDENFTFTGAGVGGVAVAQGGYHSNGVTGVINYQFP